VKLLFDENLSPKLVVRLYPDSLHVGTLVLHKAHTEGVRKFQPRVGFPTLGFWCVRYSTLKAFANTFGVDSVTLMDNPRVEATLGWNL
jgi:hypothetical protein